MNRHWVKNAKADRRNRNGEKLTLFVRPQSGEYVGFLQTLADGSAVIGGRMAPSEWDALPPWEGSDVQLSDFR